MADADIAGGALVDAERVHPAACVDDGLPFLALALGHPLAFMALEGQIMAQSSAGQALRQMQGSRG